MLGIYIGNGNTFLNSLGTNLPFGLTRGRGCTPPALPIVSFIRTHPLSPSTVPVIPFSIPTLSECLTYLRIVFHYVTPFITVSRATVSSSHIFQPLLWHGNLPPQFCIPWTLSTASCAACTCRSKSWLDFNFMQVHNAGSYDNNIPF